MAQNNNNKKDGKNPKLGRGNLVPNSNRTPNELRQMTRKGGIKSGESRRRKKQLKETAEALLQTDVDLSKLGVKARKRFQYLPIARGQTRIDLQTAAVLGQIAGMISGDARCAKYVSDLLGQTQNENELSKLDQVIVALSKTMRE